MIIKGVLEYLTSGLSSLIKSRIYKKEINDSLKKEMLTILLYMENVLGFSGFYYSVKSKELNEDKCRLKKLEKIPFDKISNLLYVKYNNEVQIMIAEIINNFNVYANLIYEFEKDDNYDNDLLYSLSQEVIYDNLLIVKEITKLIKDKKITTKTKDILEYKKQCKYI